jgi:uncharacterized protein YndB with AHSA1/START domain
VIAHENKEAVMSRIETSVEIDRPVAEVFTYLTDLRNAKEWSTEVVDVTYDGELAEGSTGTDVRTMGRKEIVMPWVVTSFDAPQRLALAYEQPFPFDAMFTFQPTDRGTRVTCVTDLHPRGWWRLLAPIIAREARKADQVQFAKVKAILESSDRTAAVTSERSAT